MATRPITSTANALYRVFILPASQTPTYRPLLLSPPTSITRPFSQTTRRPLREARAPEIRAQKWDEEIESPWIHLVNDAGQLEPQPRRLRQVLQTLDRKKERIVQLSEDGGITPQGIPVCRIKTIRAIHEDAARQERRQKEQKRLSRLRDQPKSLELNWAIGPNDLGHRMDKLKAFLAEGRRVEIILAAKKKGRKATDAECNAVLDTIRKTVESVPGASFMGELEGSLGAFSMLRMQGKPLQVTKATNVAENETVKEE